MRIKQLGYLIGILLAITPVYAAIYNITAADELQDTYVNNGLLEAWATYSAAPEVIVARYASIIPFISPIIRRAYYKFSAPACYTNLTCAVLHLYAPVGYSSIGCRSIKVMQQVQIAANASTNWHIPEITWNNQPCNTVLDNAGNCNITILTVDQIECRERGLIFNITSAFNNQCNATGLYVQLMAQVVNETNGIDFTYLFASMESTYGNGTQPYVEVYYNGSACGYSADQFSGLGLTPTVTTIFAPDNETLLGFFIMPIAAQLGLSYGSAAMLFLMLIALTAGAVAAAKFKDHAREIFIIIFLAFVIFYGIMGWLAIWIIIIILMIIGLLFKSGMVKK
jgi:hypothetical protein